MQRPTKTTRTRPKKEFCVRVKIDFIFVDFIDLFPPTLTTDRVKISEKEDVGLLVINL